MSTNENEKINEQLFRIGEVARLISVSPSTIRYWEKLGLIRPKRIQGRNRYYNSSQIEILRAIQHKRRVEGLNIQGIRRDLQREGAGFFEDRTPDSHPGPLLAKARRRQNWTLRHLAKLCDLSVSYLSALERGKANASLETLHRVTKALGLTSLALLENEPGHSGAKLVHPHERQKMKTGSPGIVLELLSRDVDQLEPHLVTIPPGGGSGDSYAHPGEEFLYVLEGTIEVILDEVNIYRLNAGDALTFSSEIAHRLINSTGQVAKAIWINTPPTF